MGHDHAQDGAAAQTKEHQEFDQRKAAAWLLAGGLRIAFLILFGVRKLGGGTIGHLDRASLKLALPADAPIRREGRVGQGFFQPFLGQALACLHIGRSALVNAALALGLKEGLDGADNLAAGGLGFEHLPEETFQGEPEAENTLATVGTRLGRRQEFRRQKLAQLLRQRRKVQLTQGLEGALSLGGQSGAQGRKERRRHHRAVDIPPY